MQQDKSRRNYHLPNGERFALGPQIAQGGEGTVHDVADNSHLVAKIYRPGKRPADIAQKLGRMIKHPPGGIAPDNVAWPLARILTESGETQGYIMRKAPPGAIPAAVFTSRKLRRQRADMRTRSREETQRIMAQIVAQYADTMQALHDAGYAIGDVNDKNLLAWPDGQIMVLDTDSFQVPNGNGRNFRCTVGRAEYQAPEIIEMMSQPCRSDTCPEPSAPHNAGYACFDRTPDHDGFSLAIIAYQALCDGRHPYSGRLSPSAQPAQKSVDRIRHGYFPFHDHGAANITPAKDQKLEWEALTPELQQYFRQAFKHR